MTGSLHPSAEQEARDHERSSPSGWVMLQLKYLVSCNDEVLAETTDSDFEFEYLEISDVDHVHGLAKLSILTFASAPSRARRVVRNGDVLVSTVRTYLKSVACVGLSESTLIASTGFVVLRARYIDSKFLKYVCLGQRFLDQVVARSVGISYPAINASDLVRIPIAVPSRSNQRQIADFLDRETAQIDQLIGKQNALIELLGERRKAVITQAVTRGLDLSAKMKVSGSKRLPKIPETWSFAEIGWNAFVGNGSTPNRENADFWADGTIPWLNSSHVNRDRVEGSDQFVTEHARTACHLPMVAPESVLVGLTGEGKTRGMATMLGIPATINQHLAYLTPYGSRLRPTFLYWAIKASYTALRELSGENGSTKGGLTCAALKHFRIAVPPCTEQDRISAYLAEVTSQIDRTVHLTRKFVALAMERRSALITAAVTGKIDVGGAA